MRWGLGFCEKWISNALPYSIVEFILKLLWRLRGDEGSWAMEDDSAGGMDEII